MQGMTNTSGTHSTCSFPPPHHSAPRLGSEQGGLGQNMSSAWDGGSLCARGAAIPDTPLPRRSSHPRHGASGPCHLPPPPPCCQLSSHQMNLDWLQSSAHRASLWHPDRPGTPGSHRKIFSSGTQTPEASDSSSAVWPWARGRPSELQSPHL